MKKILLLLICLSTTGLFAHDIDEAHTSLKQWTIASENKTVEASLMMLKDKVVYLENNQHQTIKYPLSALTLNDQLYVIQKNQHIQQLNTSALPPSVSKGKNWQKLIENNFGLLLWFSMLLVCFLFVRSYQTKFKFKYGYALTLIVMLGVFAGFMPKPVLGTDPLFIDSAFVPFKSKVKTRWDANYFYVEDLGLPSHPMMKGITSWQQQVPIQQCYVGTNAWQIPLNPVVAATPVPTATNFFKGAVALAANGIPIFNALNNRGEDSYLIGELDQYGGHCGRADDYHYHIAPLSLDSVNADILPIAFALDGYAVYAAKEPNGTAMTALDANHGHYLNGVYHYHGTTNYPYVVGNMVGVVTKDATDQIIPQAQARPLRPAGTPLNGATITNLQSTGTNAYSLTYTLGGQTYTVTYNWTAAAFYTFNWGAPSGTTTTTYNGQVCNFSTAVDDLFLDNSAVKIYPNPTKNGFSLDLSPPYSVNDIQSISVYDAQGRLIQKVEKYKSFIEMPFYTEGSYFVKIQFSNSQLMKKLIVQSK
jgi:hypothetical protein